MTWRNRFAPLIGVFAATALLALALSLQGCATNPLAAAETVEQQAYATYGTYVVFQERAVEVVAMPDVSLDVKRAIAFADSEAKPYVDAMVQAAITVTIAREGDTPEDRLLALNEALLAAYTAARPRVGVLVKTVSEAK